MIFSDANDMATLQIFLVDDVDGSLVFFFLKYLIVIDGEFRPEVDETDDEETIEKEEEEGVDEVTSM